MISILIELVRKDWMIFLADKKSMIFTFAVPIAIASFLGSLLGGIVPGSSSEKISAVVVDQDHTDASRHILQAMQNNKSLKVVTMDIDAARVQVKSGKAAAAIVIQKGFGDQASQAMAMPGGTKPTLPILTDPSRAVEAEIVKGNAIQSVTTGVLGDTDPDQALPFQVSIQPQGPAPKWSASAHAFAGMGVQALFFGAMEFGMAMMRDRESGIWTRMRASPLSPWLLLGGKMLGSAMLSFLTYIVVFAAGALIFGFRIEGSFLGFLLVAAGLGIFVGASGVFIAALGKTEQQSRRLSILIILVMLMLGGAWIPTFLLPTWIQKISLFTPVRWAVDGIDAVTWKGEGFQAAILPFFVLLVFGILLGIFSGSRFRWEATGA